MTINEFKGMSWKRAKLLLKKNTTLLALSLDDASLEVAKVAHNNGIDAGMAALAAHLFIREYGYASTAKMGIDIYHRLIEELKKTRPEKASELRKKMNETEEWLFFHTGYGHASVRVKWPLKPCFKKINERAGLANIMLGIAAREFMDGGGTADKLAGSALITLLSGGRTKGRKKRK